MKMIDTHGKPDKDNPIVKYLTHLNNLISDHAEAEASKDWYYKSKYDLLLDAGMEMKNEPTVSTAAAGLRLLKSLHFKPEKKQCYYNCQLAMLTSEYSHEFEYCEGFAMSMDLGIPLEHGWLIHKKTKLVVDPTWCQKEIDAVPWPNTKYFGVIIHQNDIKEGIASTESSNCHVDGYWNGWMILKEKFLNNNQYHPKEKKKAWT